MNCGCGEKLKHDESYPCMKTCVGFHSPDGHDHDDNCITRLYYCSNGHYTKLGIIPKCPVCDWKGKETCFCCIKVKEWPKDKE